MEVVEKWFNVGRREEKGKPFVMIHHKATMASLCLSDFPCFGGGRHAAFLENRTH